MSAKNAKIGFTSQAGTCIEILLPRNVMIEWIGSTDENSAREAIGELLRKGSAAIDGVAEAAKVFNETLAAANEALSSAIGVPVSLHATGLDRVVIVGMAAQESWLRKAGGGKW